MFRKKKKNQISTPQDAVMQDHPSFDFSVLPKEMRVAARDFSTLQALASLQKKEDMSILEGMILKRIKIKEVMMEENGRLF